MKRLILSALTICMTVLLTGCSDTLTNSDDKTASLNGSTTPITGNSFQSSIILSDSGTLSENDTIWYELEAEMGFSYEVGRSYYNDYGIELKIVAPNGDMLDTRDFKAYADGIYRIGVYLSHTYNNYSGPFSYKIFAKRHNPVPDKLSGKWLLVKEGGSAFGGSSEYFYSSADAMSLMEIRNDSITDYYFESYADSVSSYSELFSSSWMSEMKYTLSDNQLTFITGNSHGNYYEVYEKYTGSVDDLNWAKENLKAPSELIGTWYLSSEKWREYEFEDGEIYDESGENIYNSGAESDAIYVISSDSITIYNKDRRWNFSVSTSPVSEYYWLVAQSTINGNSFTTEEYETDTWTNIDGTEESESFMEIETFTNYSGPLPPIEWGRVTLPESYTDIKLGEGYSGTLDSGDSLWFRIPVSYAEEYQFTVTSGNFDTYLSMISQDETAQGSDDDSGADLLSSLHFIADIDGFYYVLLTGYSSSDEGTFALSYSGSSSRSEILASTVQASKAVKSKRDRRSRL